MRRMPMRFSNYWLAKEKGRGEVFHKPCYRCGNKFWVPRYLLKAQPRCQDCETDEDRQAMWEACADFRRSNMLSPLIEEALDDPNGE